MIREAEKIKDSFCDLLDSMHECYEDSKASDEDELNYRNMRSYRDRHHNERSRSNMDMRRSYGRYDY